MASDSPAMEQSAPIGRENQLRFLVNVAVRWWAVIALSTALLSLGFGGYGLMQAKRRPAVTAQATLTLKVVPSQWMDLRDVGGPGVAEFTAQDVIDEVDKSALAVEVARALVQRDVERGGPNAALVSEQDLQAKANEIERMISFEPILKTPQIVLKVKAAGLDEARDIAEYAARVFISLSIQSMQGEKSATHAFIRQQIDLMGEKLDAVEKREWNMREAMGFRTKDQILGDMESKRQELMDADTQKTQIELKLKELEQKLREKNAQLPEALGQITDEVVKKLMSELDNLLQEQLSMSIIYQPEFPGLQDLQAEIDEKKQAILEAVGRVEASTVGGADVWAERESLRQQYTQLQLQLAELDVRGRTIRKILDSRVEELLGLSDKTRDYMQVQNEVEQLRTQFSGLIKKEIEIRNQIERGVGRVDREGQPQVAPVSGQGRGARYWVNFIIGGVAGFVIGFAFAFVYEMLDTSIRGIDDVLRYVGLEVIGTIPKMKFTRRRGHRRGVYVTLTDDEQTDACIVTQHDPKSPISEAYRALRTNFQFATIQEKPRVLMVTSAVPGEGKTTTAVNLAVTFADSGVRVLLIDTDLRRPHVHHVLKMERGRGLADVLREGVDFRGVIRPTRVENLSIISSGRVPPNPSELIGSTRMQQLMMQLRGEFDLIICDAPSIHVVTDPVLLAMHMDTVLLVVSAGYARRETIFLARKRLDAAQCPIAGVVLNGLEATRRHYYYYYYYYDDSATRRRKSWYHL